MYEENKFLDGGGRKKKQGKSKIKQKQAGNFL
jgi:hypothetical protein